MTAENCHMVGECMSNEECREKRKAKLNEGHQERQDQVGQAGLAVRTAMKSRLALVALLTGGMLGMPAPVIAKTDFVEVKSTTFVQGTVVRNYSDGSVEISDPLWSGNIPTRVRTITKSQYQSCFELKFQIQAHLPFNEMSSANGVDVTFELWSRDGEKLDTEWVDGRDWNPLDRPTMVVWLTCDTWLMKGTYDLVIRTDQTLSTDGLISRYVTGSHVVELVIEKKASTVNSAVCKKGKKVKTFQRATCPAGWKRLR